MKLEQNLQVWLYLVKFGLKQASLLRHFTGVRAAILHEETTQIKVKGTV